MTPARLQAIGLGIIRGTLAGIAFAVTGALVGPSGLVGVLLLIGGLLVALAHVLRRRAAKVQLEDRGA